MIQNITNAIYQSLSELVTRATMDEMTGDYAAFKEKLKILAQIAELLNVDTEIISVTVNIKNDATVVEVMMPDEPRKTTNASVAVK